MYLATPALRLMYIARDMPGELRCRPHLPLPGTVAAGLPGSVECRRCVSTGSRNTRRRPCCRMTVAVWRVMGVADGEERPQAAERRTALSSHRWAE